MKNIFLFIIFTSFLPFYSDALPNNVIIECDLPAPINLHAVEVGPSYATMSWDAVPWATGYRVSWFDESGTPVGSENIFDTEYEVQGLESGKPYEFRVASLCDSGEPGPVYSKVPIVPIVLELVISSDNPLGNLSLVCEKDIDPMAECLVDFSVSTTFIGKIKIQDLNKVYYFRIRYFNDGIKNIQPKIVIDLTKPIFYPEPPIDKPGLFTEYGEPSGYIYQYGSARTYNFRLYQISITKKFGSTYKLNILNSPENKLSSEFTLSFRSKSDSLIEPIDEFEESQVENLEKETSTNVKYIRIINMTGTIVKETTLNGDDNLNNHIFKDLLSGIYIINTYQNQNITSKLFFLGTN